MSNERGVLLHSSLITHPALRYNFHTTMIFPNLLATKFHPPALPARQVLRPHLVQKLNEGLQAGYLLTLVSAPAGFGKSTCVREWIASLDLPFAWLSLDPSDDDPVRFFAYFLAALQRIDETIGRELAGSIGLGQIPPLEVLATTLLNDISALPVRFVLVLDDFQVIQERVVLQVLERLLAALPPQMHLVLVTREDPVLPLSRLRANSRMAEIRAGDLRFTSAEAASFLNEMMGLALSGCDMTALENRTEGWVVGLQLAGLSMRGRADPSGFIASLRGSNRYILSYLTEEVLRRQPDEIQQFLLETSILDKLNGDLCGAVTGRNDSADLLERLLAANLFLIALDDDQRWYRYHHLFADLLRSRLNHLQKERVAELHRRAMAWYEQNGMASEAIQHAMETRAYDRAVELIERYAPMTVNQGYVKTVEDWMQAIPVEWQSQSPKANMAFAWMHLLRGSYPRMASYLQSADAAIRKLEEDQPDNANTIALRAEWYVLQCGVLHVQGRTEEGVKMAEQALRLARPDDDNVRGLAYYHLATGYREMGDYGRSVEHYRQGLQISRASGNSVSEMLAVVQLARMAYQNGQLRFSVEVTGQTIERAERLEQQGQPPPPIMGAVYGAHAQVYYEWDLLDEALAYYRRGLHLSRLGGHNAGVVFMQIPLARIALARGDLETAARITQETVELLQLGVPAWVRPEVLAHQVRLALAQENLVAADAVLAPLGISLQNTPRYPDEALYLALLRLKLAQGADLPAALGLADRVIARSETENRRGIMLQALLLRARLRSALGSSAAALDDLAQALTLAEPENWLRLFLDEDEEISSLLAQVARRKPRSEFAQKLLAAFTAREVQSVPSIPDAPAVELVEPLTERELDVLRLIAEGLKYEEIAERLVITLNTVRFYVKEIYSKLNVNNRTRAVDLARQMNLIS